jgi:hypothetical protein
VSGAGAYFARGRWGEDIPSPPQRVLAQLLASLDIVDPEHPDVSLRHESGWCLSAYPSGLLVWENVEAGAPPPKHMTGVSRERVLELWKMLAAGEIDRIAALDWRAGAGPIAGAAAGPPPIEPEARELLRRIGAALVVFGGGEIAWTVHVFASDGPFFTGLGVPAVIAGVLLRRENLRVARAVRLYAGFAFVAFLGVTLAFAAILPPAFVATWFRITAPLDAAATIAVWLALVLVPAWAHVSLRAPAVERAFLSRLGRGRFLQPASGLLLGAGLVILLGLMLLEMRGETGRRAIETARAETGPGYRYFVSSLSVSYGAERTVNATVVAYTDSDIQTVDVQWSD